MKSPLFLALAALPLGLAAHAAPPPSTVDEDEVVVPAEAPSLPVEAAQAVPAAPTLPAVPPGAVQGPVYFNGPVYIIPAYPLAGEAPFSPPQLTAPPMAAAPVRQVQPVSPPVRVAKSVALAHRFGLGVRASGLWVNQRLFGSDLTMLGAGALLRYRVLEHFALEGTVDVVGRDYHDGAYKRTSVPIQLAAVAYMLPDRAQTHFNVYGLAGGGIMPSRLHLNDGVHGTTELSANEILGQLGVGCELRTGRISFYTDARAQFFYRTGDEATFTSFIAKEPTGTGLQQAAIPDKTYGWHFSAGAMLWL